MKFEKYNILYLQLRIKIGEEVIKLFTTYFNFKFTHNFGLREERESMYQRCFKKSKTKKKMVVRKQKKKRKWERQKQFSFYLQT